MMAIRAVGELYTLRLQQTQADTAQRLSAAVPRFLRRDVNHLRPWRKVPSGSVWKAVHSCSRSLAMVQGQLWTHSALITKPMRAPGSCLRYGELSRSSRLFP